MININDFAVWVVIAFLILEFSKTPLYKDLKSVTKKVIKKLFKSKK
jgi:hypothetical protein